ncbi:hypothetical protein Hanom_Chr16g01435991 [Helianthus anomalus]
MVWMFIYKKIRFLYLCNRRSNPSRIGLFYQFHLLISSSYHNRSMDDISKPKQPFNLTASLVTPLPKTPHRSLV